MKMVYEAAHGVEAHMIADLLRQQGITGRVEGEYLVGAMGGLPASGLVRVVVDESDYEPAMRVLEHWRAAEAVETGQAQRRAATPAALHWSWFAAGLLVGAFMTWLGTSGHRDGGSLDTALPLCRP